MTIREQIAAWPVMVDGAPFLIHTLHPNDHETVRMAQRLVAVERRLATATEALRALYDDHDDAQANADARAVLDALK